MATNLDVIVYGGGIGLNTGLVVVYMSGYGNCGQLTGLCMACGGKKDRGKVTRLHYGVTGQSNAAIRSTADSPIGY